MSESPSQPEFDVRLDPPDLTDWIAGNTGIPGVWTFESGQPGPHAAICALMHGNEYSGALILRQLLEEGVRPAIGRLSLAFLNLEAFSRFDPRRPTVSRFVDEDMNRVWDPPVLDGPRRTQELDRARVLRPWVDTVDVLLDLHSMLWPSDPVVLCGGTARGRALALSLPGPRLIISDRGHGNGRRLIDYPRFADPDGAPVANLLEAGQHWDAETVAVATGTVTGLLAHVGVTAADVVVPPPGSRLFARVTDVVTAATSQFAFVQPFRGGDIVPARNTLIAMDGDTEIRTPYDNCMLVMPSLRAGRGHTAVRLARLEPVAPG